MTNSMFDNESKSDREEENVVFHYSHDHRIKNAPKVVQDYYNGNFELNKGLKVLVKNKSNRFILIALVIMTVFALIYSRINSSRNKGELDGFKLELTSFAFEEKIYTTLKIEESQKKKTEEREPVVLNIVFKSFDVNNQVFDVQEKSVLMEKNLERLQTLVTDFDITNIEASVSSGNKKVVLISGVKR